ncbi:MAG: hypothetical protein AB7E69_16390 [Sphingomonadales bacterium]
MLFGKKSASGKTAATPDVFFQITKIAWSFLLHQPSAVHHFHRIDKKRRLGEKAGESGRIYQARAVQQYACRRIGG